jgi:hypothetical protein
MWSITGIICTEMDREGGLTSDRITKRRINSAHFDGPRVPELGTTTSHGYLHLGVYQNGAVHLIIKTEEVPAEGITGL